METTEKLEFYKEEKGAEKIVKEKKISTKFKEKLAKKIADVVLADVVLKESEYKQIVAWWEPNEWKCTFRTSIIPFEDTTDSKCVKEKEDASTPFFFEYRDEGYWIMKVDKAIDNESRDRINEIRKIMRGALEAEKK